MMTRRSTIAFDEPPDDEEPETGCGYVCALLDTPAREQAFAKRSALARLDNFRSAYVENRCRRLSIGSDTSMDLRTIQVATTQKKRIDHRYLRLSNDFPDLLSRSGNKPLSPPSKAIVTVIEK